MYKWISRLQKFWVLPLKLFLIYLLWTLILLLGFHESNFGFLVFNVFYLFLQQRKFILLCVYRFHWLPFAPFVVTLLSPPHRTSSFLLKKLGHMRFYLIIIGKFFHLKNFAGFGIDRFQQFWGTVKKSEKGDSTLSWWSKLLYDFPILAIISITFCSIISMPLGIFWTAKSQRGVLAHLICVTLNYCVTFVCPKVLDCHNMSLIWELCVIFSIYHLLVEIGSKLGWHSLHGLL